MQKIIKNTFNLKHLLKTPETFLKTQKNLKNISLSQKSLKQFCQEQQQSSQKRNIEDVPDIKDFLKKEGNEMSSLQFEDTNPDNFIPYIEKDIEKGKKFIINTYGCQMNENDSEIINGIMQKEGYIRTQDQKEADIILFNTCSIREGAESKIWKKLSELRAQRRQDKRKVVTGVLGCMAERLKEKLVEENKVVDLVAGPDAYRDLPRLLQELSPEKYQMNVQLSLDETYADITPIRLNEKSKQAFVSIMRGCNNMCSYCIVPFTRGRERSRSISSIKQEIHHLQAQGVKEITLLGQNVNSYFDNSSAPKLINKETEKIEEIEEEEEEEFTKHSNSKGFNEMYKLRAGTGPRFADLLTVLAEEFPNIRFRFTSPHPKDFPDSVLYAIKNHPNIAKNIHMPAQHGNTDVLTRMRRNHTKEAYLDLVFHIKKTIPGITLSSDFIAGFCGETDAEFEDTMELLEKVKYEQAFLFAYSMRERTHAHRRMKDDVPEPVKKKRLQRMIDSYHMHQGIVTKEEVGRFHLCLIDGVGKKANQLKGRTDTNRICIIEQEECQNTLSEEQLQICSEQMFEKENKSIFNELMQKQQQNDFSKMENGDFVLVYITDVTQRSLFCTPIAKTTIPQFAQFAQNKPFICPTFFNQFE